MNSCGISDMTYNSIVACDAGLQKLFYPEIVVSGGTSMLPGIVDRLRMNIMELAPRFVMALFSFMDV